MTSHPNNSTRRSDMHAEVSPTRLHFTMDENRSGGGYPCTALTSEPLDRQTIRQGEEALLSRERLTLIHHSVLFYERWLEELCRLQLLLDPTACCPRNMATAVGRHAIPHDAATTSIIHPQQFPAPLQKTSLLLLTRGTISHDSTPFLFLYTHYCSHTQPLLRHSYLSSSGRGRV